MNPLYGYLIGIPIGIFLFFAEQDLRVWRHGIMMRRLNRKRRAEDAITLGIIEKLDDRDELIFHATKAYQPFMRICNPNGDLLYRGSPLKDAPIDELRSIAMSPYRA